jgi:hypothetical protein
MGREDRYGYQHRDDPAHDVGDSKPGDVGDSKGTFHDRARKDSTVIVDGETQSLESYQRSSVEAEQSKKKSETEKVSTHESTSSGGSISQDEAAGNVVTLTASSTGGTLDSLGKYKNHQVHIEGATAGETIRVRLEKGQGFLIGRRIKVNE